MPEETGFVITARRTFAEDGKESEGENQQETAHDSQDGSGQHEQSQGRITGATRRQEGTDEQTDQSASHENHLPILRRMLRVWKQTFDFWHSRRRGPALVIILRLLRTQRTLDTPAPKATNDRQYP